MVTMVDRGHSSAENLAYLRRVGGHFIAGIRMRDYNPLVEQVLARQSRYQQVRENMLAKGRSASTTPMSATSSVTTLSNRPR